jgi:hypothetical protein
MITESWQDRIMGRGKIIAGRIMGGVQKLPQKNAKERSAAKAQSNGIQRKGAKTQRRKDI